MSYTVPIPLQLLENLQNVFQSEARKLCREVATTLGIPSQHVIQNVLTDMPKLPLQVFDLDVPPLCMCLLNEEKMWFRCRKPCVLGTGRCIHHQSVKQEEPESEKVYRRIAHKELNETLWADEQSSTVWNAKGECVGEIHGQTLFRFEMGSN